MSFGKTRFASPTDFFKILYIAKDVVPALPKQSFAIASREGRPPID